MGNSAFDFLGNSKLFEACLEAPRRMGGVMRLVEDANELTYLIRGKLMLPMFPTKVDLFGI